MLATLANGAPNGMEALETALFQRMTFARTTTPTLLTLLSLTLVTGVAHAEGTEKSAAAPAIATPAAQGASAPAAQPSAPAAQPSQMPPHRLSELVSLQLEDADLSDLVRVVGQVTGKRFLIASPRLGKIKASLYAPEKVTAQEAYQALLAVLTANGLTVVPNGGFYRIVESENIARQVVPLDQSDKGSPEERYVTRIHRMKHLSAEEVATGVLAKLATKDASIVPYAAGNLLIMTETGANLRRMMEIVEAIDQPGTDAKLYFQPLSHVSSSAAEKLLTELLDLKKKEAAAPGAALYVGRLVAVERPNALIIVATEASYQRIFELLSRIDVLEPNETQVHVVALQHADAKKIVGPLAAAIGSSSAGQAVRPAAGATPQPAGNAGQVLEGPAQISADETTNSLIVTAGPRDFANIKDVIAALDKPKRQVFIEAVILDISDSSGLDLGVAFHGGNVDSSTKGNTTEFGGFRAASSALPPSTADLQGLALGVTGPSIPFNTGITGITTIPSIGAFLTAAATTKGADILSTPSITASDNTPAEIKVQLNASLQPHAPQPAQYLTGTAGALPQTSTGVTSNYKAIGPRVKITPHLNDSDEVRLDIEEVISDIASEPGASDTYGTVSFIERAATTTMTVKDGSTAVIGGLVRNIMRRSENKIPILGDVPVLGALFRTRSDQMEKSNLVLILTPYIIHGEEDMRRIAERKKEERQVLIDHAAVFSDNAAWKPPVDYHRTHGLLTAIAQESRGIERQRQELSSIPVKDTNGPVAVAPMELPIPLSPASQGVAPAAPKPSEKPAPPGQLRTVEK